MGNLEPSSDNGNLDASPGTPGPTRVRYAVLAAGCSMAFIAYLDRIGFGNYLKVIAKEFQFDAEEAGYLTSAFLIAYAGCQIPAGLTGDRFGARRMLTLFVVGWSLATAAIALVPSQMAMAW